ncbi:hypothetical protein [Bradyrhizobium sp. 147]|uniref:hypothetical protein n=1 Tax=Bradyrhizobium sp. 147 TaxID=2782623 RepID=UPI001FF76545|nr:hypothetical protein [Bradyrhizobium sp. 147]
MARKVRHSALESRSARLKLQVRRKPYSGPSLARGVSLLYRRNKGSGAWVVKTSNGHGAYWTKASGLPMTMAMQTARTCFKRRASRNNSRVAVMALATMHPSRLTSR